MFDKKVLDSRSPVEPKTFRVRAENYLRDKKKEHAPNYASYHPFSVDVFLSQRKIDHIARKASLHSCCKCIDGEGMNVVLYFKLLESYAKEVSSQFQDNMRRILDDEIEKVKEDLELSAPERKLMDSYNKKHLLSRPRYEFYQGRCAPFCPFLEVFPAEAPYTDESLAKAKKIISKMEIDYARRCLADAYIFGGDAAAKALVGSWIVEYEVREKDPLRGFAGKVTNLEKVVAWCENNFGPIPAASSSQEEDVSETLGPFSYLKV
ncbi:hypothetical protein CTI12_AA070590 [Artemisia annua]|uniref:Protein ENHANCED DISEASE RESISTANCE 2 C-terminal domain-containing protein n=1 Tax=Artemisia annua TaxID=35608 RepID=A0A2U1Q628_ARTAN|nr:hypothetical protein CTI12_AA070590 [Artemisia annua]